MYLSNLDNVFIYDVKKVLSKKKLLVEKVFETAKKELPNGSKSSIASYLSILFEEKFGITKDERTFVRFYKTLVEENKDYKIDPITLDHMSSYIGYENFNDFCTYYKNDPITQEFGSVKVSISDGNDPDNPSDTLSKVVVNITNAPVFKLPEFISNHKNSLGILGLMVLSGIFVHKQGYFSDLESKIENSQEKVASANQPQHVVSPPSRIIQVAGTSKEEHIYTKQTIVQEVRNRECMYWSNDHYESVFCDDPVKKDNSIALNEDLTVLFMKITKPDTLTVENALGKVWYDKSNKKVEFFTHHGTHPVNGKTLKPVTKYIIEKYVYKDH